MTIRPVALLFLLSIITCASSAENLKIAQTTAQAPLAPGERTLAPMYVDVKVSSEGKVTAVRPDPNIPAAFADLFSKAINQWQFSPAKRNGVPIDWATRMTFMLTAVPAEKGFAMRISSISMATVWIDNSLRLRAAEYPSRRQSKGRDADVLAYCLVSDEGRLSVKTIFVNGQVAKDNDPFAMSAKEAVNTWKLNVLQWDGVSYPEPLLVPVRFYLSDSKDKSPHESALSKIDFPELGQFTPVTLKEARVGTML